MPPHRDAHASADIAKPASSNAAESIASAPETFAPASSAGANMLEGDAGTAQKTPLGLKIFGILGIVGGCLLIPQIALMVLVVGIVFRDGGFAEEAMVTQVLYLVLVACTAVAVVAFIVLGVRLVRNKRRLARQTAEFIIALIAAALACNLMIFGVSPNLAEYVVVGVVLVAIHTYIDPSLSEERELQRKLRDMETREDAEEGTLGRDTTGKGFIALDFFNLFWIFVIACVLGDAIETIYHVIVVDPGHYQVRAGMLWGPFSPIYGFGAVLMTLALNRFHKAPLIIVFVVSAVIGGAFEYAVSWFLQFAFGVTAWDYSGTFLNIGGRTNFMFMCMWGALGVVWIKLLLPTMLNLVNLIPWKWRYTITSVCAVLMVFNGAMTLITLDCWYSRLAGLPNDNAVMEFCAANFDNDWMANRFQSMTIDPDNATRAH